MGIGRKVGAFLGLVPEDEARFAGGEAYEYPEDYPDRDYAEREYSAAGSFSSGRAEFAEYSEREYREEFDEDQAPAARRPGSYADAPEPTRRTGRYQADAPVDGALAVKAAPVLAARRDDNATSGRPWTVKLSGFGEARMIGERYRDGQSVILDMTDMSDSDARRLVDFSAGLAFSLHGSIDRVAPKVFMLLPPDVDVAAATASYHSR